MVYKVSTNKLKRTTNLNTINSDGKIIIINKNKKLLNNNVYKIVVLYKYTNILI